MKPDIKTVAGVFSSLVDADRAARNLEGLGIPSDNVSLIAGNDGNRHDEYLKKARRASTTTARAAASAASIGGGVGILATLAALAVPGVGPLVAGGAMLTVLGGLAVGAVGGGLVGAFVSMGFSREEAPLYEEAVRRGAVILAAQIYAEQEQEAIRIMTGHGSRSIREMVSGSDPHPYPWDDTVRATEPSEPAARETGAGIRPRNE